MCRCSWMVLGCLIGLMVFSRTSPAGSPASEALLAWWGDMRAVQYPATERDPDAVKQVQDNLRQFRAENPKALMLDVGGMLGPICTSESPYELPPLPFYASIQVAGANLSQGDWIDMSPLYMYSSLKAPEGVRESRVRLCGVVAKVLRKGLDLLGIDAPERI